MTSQRPPLSMPGPVRVTYWTGIWDPAREALSKEVVALRRALAPGSPVVSFTPQPSGFLFRERVVKLNVHRWIGLRVAAVAVERLGHVTHVFGGVDAAHFLHVLGRRPIVFTVAIPGEPLESSLYEKVACFVAESEVIAATLRGAGVPSDRIRILYPGINLAKYAPVPPPTDGPFRLLFASTPSHTVDLDSRGIWLLLELARLRPELQIVLLWRKWGDVRAALAQIEARRPPANFVVQVADAADMSREFRAAHATVCCFAEGTGKSAPNSVLEGLATGRPALVSDTCGIAGLIGESGGGVVTARSAEGLAAGIDAIRADYDRYAAAARVLAERHFDRDAVQREYAQIYKTLAAPAVASRR